MHFHFDLFSPIPLLPESLFASGRDGTTDVTRTMHFGTPSAYEKVGWHLSVFCNLTLIITDT